MILGLKGLTYQQNSRWVIISFILKTSLTEKALIYITKRNLTLERKGSRTAVIISYLSSLKESLAKRLMQGRENLRKANSNTFEKPCLMVAGH